MAENENRKNCYRQQKAPDNAGAFVCAEISLSRSRAAAELVVHANPDNVAIEVGRGACANRFGPEIRKTGWGDVNGITAGRVFRRAQIIIEIFQLGGPIGREHPFGPATCGPTETSV